MKIKLPYGFVTIFFAFTFLNLQAGEFADSTLVKVNDITIIGNKKTNEKIILRELLFQPGDTIRQSDLELFISRSKDNLVNTSLFNYITFNVIRESAHLAQVFILVEERWYIWPYLIFEQADRNLSAFLHNQEWDRINYGFMLVKNNFRGRRETVKLKARFGYNEQFQLAYVIPYVGGSKKHGLATEISWNRTHEVAYNVSNDQLLYYKDENSYVQKYQSVMLEYKYRPKHFFDHNISLGYIDKTVSDSVVMLNPEFYGNSETFMRYLVLGYSFSIDNRNYKHYPLKGNNFSISASRLGLNILPDETKGLWSLAADYYHYTELSKRWFTGVGGRTRLSSPSQQPFALQGALGYYETLRSFEYNVVYGQHFVTGHTFLKYALIPEKIVYIEKWKWEKFNKIHYSFYVNTFIDAGYVVNKYNTPDNQLPNQFLVSGGIGLDLVSYYDQIIRFEYSVSQKGQSGFYLHVGKAF